VALSRRVEGARPAALGDEVPRALDLAMGTSFRGTHQPFLPSPFSNSPFFSLSLRPRSPLIINVVDGAAPLQVAAMVSIILRAYLSHPFFASYPENWPNVKNKNPLPLACRVWLRPDPFLWFRLRFRAVQGWPSVIPRFSAVDFVSFYIQLPVMAIMYFLWLVVHRMFKPRRPPLATQQPTSASSDATSPLVTMRPAARSFFDFVDLSRVNLYRDEHEDSPFDKHEDEVRVRRMRGFVGWVWALYYYIVA
jgi:hypothetical protein